MRYDKVSGVSPTQKVVRDAAARRSAKASNPGEEKISLRWLRSALSPDKTGAEADDNDTCRHWHTAMMRSAEIIGALLCYRTEPPLELMRRDAITSGIGNA